MKHFGDITKLSGDVLPIVDVITGGSPCQDLSVAGKRAGLAGERSGLFMEQMRIVKEMRERDVRDGRPAQYVRPRYMVWENVHGAFSSGSPKGSDFQAVLEEIVRVVCKEAPPVPIPKEGWPKAGCISGVGDSGCTFSIAWRVHDAQFWGVPQRRKRIALVADFGGLSAPEILFERKGLSGNSEQSGAQREATAGGTGKSAEISVWCLQGNGIDRADTAGCNGKGWREDQCYTLNTIDRPAVMAFAQNQVGEVRVSSMSGTLNTNSNATGRNSPLVYDARGNGDGKTVCTITGDHENCVADYTALCVGNGQANQSVSDKAGALNTMHDQQAVLTFDKEMYNCGEKLSGEPQARYDTVAPTVRADSHPSGICQSVVRRLTPLECERLQGYPDGWTDIGEWTDTKGKKHKPADGPRYKALGNSIALPFWQYLARRICAQYERNITMASLFDGIGGFPLVFERCGAKAVWASEIEEFPIAVTKKHFPEE